MVSQITNLTGVFSLFTFSFFTNFNGDFEHYFLS